MQGNNFLKITLLSVLLACPNGLLGSGFIQAYENAKNAYLDNPNENILFHVESALINLEKAPAHRAAAIRRFGADFFETERAWIEEEAENLEGGLFGGFGRAARNFMDYNNDTHRGINTVAPRRPGAGYARQNVAYDVDDVDVSVQQNQRRGFNAAGQQIAPAAVQARPRGVVQPNAMAAAINRLFGGN